MVLLFFLFAQFCHMVLVFAMHRRWAFEELAIFLILVILTAVFHAYGVPALIMPKDEVNWEQNVVVRMVQVESENGKIVLETDFSDYNYYDNTLRATGFKHWYTYIYAVPDFTYYYYERNNMLRWNWIDVVALN